MTPSTRIALPSDRRNLNGPLRGARNTTMLNLIGNPRGSYGNDCRPVLSPKVKKLIVTEDVGPFRATGLKPAISTLRAILADVQTAEPDVYRLLGSAGMLCCRYVRGSTSSLSNHSWGTAIDLTIDGRLDARGDGYAQAGLLQIYPIFNRHLFFWGAAFNTEDAMHFEASDQLIRQWYQEGWFTDGGPAPALGASAPAPAPLPQAVVDDVLSFGDRGQEIGDLQARLNVLLGVDLDVDGIFGSATRAAVIELQRQNGLVADGIVGPRTRQLL